MTHGTFTSYMNGQCRCVPCTSANRDHQKQSRRWYHDLTAEQRRHCQICHTPIAASHQSVLEGSVKLLDLYAGAGGAAYGYHLAGFDEIVGIDVVNQPHYPFTFIQGDALQPPVRLEDFDLIHASPPCKSFTKTGWAYHFGYHDRHADLLGPTRVMLEKSGRPWIIENVPGAPMRPDVVLCGSLFGLGVRRHRWFESNVSLFALMPTCDHSRPVVSPHGRPNSAKGNRHDWARAMDIDWMPRAEELAQAIPPAYTRWLGEQFLQQAAA